MPKVYITRKKLNEDVSITDSTLAQQYLAVKKQMADKRTKRDQLMKNVNAIDSELNILEKNLIAIETKSAQKTGETAARKPENTEKSTSSQGDVEESGMAQYESLNELFIPLDDDEGLNDYREEVIEAIGEIYHDGETLTWEFSDILENSYYDDQPADHCAKLIVDADRNLPINHHVEEDGYIGGDTQSKIATNARMPIRVANESLDEDPIAYAEDMVISVNGEEKIIKSIERYSNNLIIYFDDGSEMTADELNKQDVEYIRDIEFEDDYDMDDDDNDYNEERELALLDLQRDLEYIEQEEQQAYIDMEQDLANYDESTHVPSKNTRASLASGEKTSETMPHDVWGGILNDIDQRKEEIKNQIRQLNGTADSAEMTYDQALKLRNEGLQAEYGRINHGPSNMADDEGDDDLEESSDWQATSREEWEKGMIATRPISPFESTNESVYDEIMNDLEDEKEKIEKIQDFITQTTQRVDIDINTPDEIEINDDEPEVLEPILVDEEPPMGGMPFDLVNYDDEDDGDPYDMSVHSPGSGFYDDDEDPFALSAEEELTNETLKTEKKSPYIPDPMNEEDEETELEMMNYEEDDQDQDEYVFHVMIDEETDHEIIAKVYRDNEEDFWTVRVVKGDEEPLQSMEFDPRLDKLEIIGKLADIYDDIEIIDPKEYEYLLDDKEKVDAEYYAELEV